MTGTFGSACYRLNNLIRQRRQIPFIQTLGVGFEGAAHDPAIQQRQDNGNNRDLAAASPADS